MADLRVIEPQPENETLLTTLEWAIGLVKKGELSALAVAVVYRDGCGGHKCSKLPSIGLMVGTIARMQADIIQQADQ